jgi:Tfp pilus assembly major pilin PilA
MIRRIPTTRFTIVEMMIVVAILLVLAAIALPQVRERSLAAKLSEALVNRDGIFNASAIFIEQEGITADVTPATLPSGTPGKKARAWPTTDANWRSLGWAPDGDVRCNYQYWYVHTNTIENLNVYCNLDGNGDALTLYGQRSRTTGTWAGINCTVGGFRMNSGSLNLPSGPTGCY